MLPFCIRANPENLLDEGPVPFLEFIPPVFYLFKGKGLSIIPTLEGLKGRLNRFHVSIPQERSDALDLSSPCPVTRYVPRKSDGIQNLI